MRAEREAHHAAQLRDHPNVVAVHDLVFEDGVPWTVLRLVAGLFFVLLGVALSVTVVALSASLARDYPGFGEDLAIGAFAGLAVGFGSVGVLQGWCLPGGRAGMGGVVIGVAWMVMLTATVWPRVH
ncbi:hypothetical protein ACWEQ8_20165 [Streptomyces noursei]